MQSYGMIFDMDNTVIDSHIDFVRMKREVMANLSSGGCLPPDAEKLTVSEIMALAEKVPGKGDLIRSTWALIEQCELDGQRDVQPQPGIEALLSRLEETFVLTLLTNNAQSVAEYSLKKLGLFERFSVVMGREQLPALKPAPDGTAVMMQLFPYITRGHWLAAGDAWIDAAAAEANGVAFLGYGPGRAAVEAHGVRPLLWTEDWRTVSAQTLLQLLQERAEN